MEQRLHIATQLLAGLISLDRVRPISQRVGVVQHALDMTDLLLALHHSARPGRRVDPHWAPVCEPGMGTGASGGTTLPSAPCPCQAPPKKRGRPRKSSLH